MPRPLSKSRYLDGLQCPKLMWTRLNARDRVPAAGGWRQQVFGAGRQLGDLAKQLWEGGVEVPPFRESAERAAATQKVLPKRVPLFAAVFETADHFCRVDVLEPAPEGRWNLYEVKAGARVRQATIQDLAFQRETLAAAGVALDRCYVLHVDTGYVLGEHLHVHELFRRVDVTERVLQVAPYVARTVASLRAAADGPEPDQPIGPHCRDPHECRLIPACWAGLPADNVTELHRAGRGAFALMDEGIFRIRDVPDARLSDLQRIQKQAVVSGEVHLDRAAVRRWLDHLVWPLWYLDFETMAPAVPIFPGTRPYQQLAFQFSLHRQDLPAGPLHHHEFLHTDVGDPRPALAAALAETVGPRGSLVAWNMDYEKMVLGDLAAARPEHAGALEAMAARLVDLAEPWLTFAVHHPGQRGSTSLKAVLPTVTGLAYDDLEIGSGAEATHAYEAVMAAGASLVEREAVFRSLRRYCARDTYGLAELLKWLQAAAD